MVMEDLDWLFAIGCIFFIISIWGIGANDVANSFATSVSSRSLTMVQAGILATICEFVGAMALGQGVTGTVRHGIFSVKPFLNSPGTLILAMVVAEIGSATWLTVCTKLGFPVSTTQSIVGALIGVGIASELHITWAWHSDSVSQIAASWAIAPCIAAGFGAIIMLSIRLLVHSRADPLQAALRVISFYYALTAAVLTLFIVISGGHGIPSLDEMGAGKVIGIILGVFFGVLAFSFLFFTPFFYAKLVKEDTRLRFWHLPMGPLLWRDSYTLYWPGNPDHGVVPDYYASEYKKNDSDEESNEKVLASDKALKSTNAVEPGKHHIGNAPETTGLNVRDEAQVTANKENRKELTAVDTLPWAHPYRLWAMARLVFSYGITRDVIGHQSKGLEDVHRRAPVFDNKVEHLWTTAQICSAMIMSISHGANDVSNAIGPFTTEYETWHSGVASAKTETPLWIRAVGGLGLGFGFWTFGYHIMRSLGNRITKHSPTRGFSMELAAAITVLMASKLNLPVSTTQCITGAVVGVALVNADLKSINWKQLGKIFIGWALTLPCAGLVSGILMGMALNVPQWGRYIQNLKSET